MSIVEYLESGESVEDVGLMLGHAQRLNGGTTDSPVGWLEFDDGAWRVVKWENLHAYYRAEGDRYVVTDLGEAVRALRLRTGGFLRTEQIVAAIFDQIPGAHTGVSLDGIVTGALAERTAAADLPRAIVRVMLAAHRVASLEAP